MNSAARFPNVIGLTLLVFSLFLYRSYEHRPVLDRWSHPYAALLAVAVLLLGLRVASAVRSSRRGRSPSPPTKTFDLAILVWGVAYLLSAIDDPRNAGRILDLNIVGSISPIATVLEWIAITLATTSGVTWAATRLGDTGRKILLSATAIGIVVLLGEGALRLRAAISPTTQGFPTHTSAQWTRRYVQLNSEGFRDAEHAQTAPDGIRRLLVVGDSFAFGSGINDVSDRLGEQLTQVLSETTGESWRSLSAALGDSDTLDEIQFLRQMEAYERDAVLLVYVFNDIDYLRPVTARTALTEQPRGIVERLHPVRLLFLNSYFFQEFFVRTRLLTYALNNDSPQSESPYFDDDVLALHLDDLARFVDLAAEADVPVWIAPFDVERGEYFASRYARFQESALARGLPILSLAETFSGLDRTSLRLNRLDGHPSVMANRLAAKGLAEKLNRSLDLDGPAH